MAVISAISALSGADGPSAALHTAFAGPLRWSGVAQVYVRPYFWAPRSRDGDTSLLEVIQAAAEEWAKQRLVQRQPWYRSRRPQVDTDLERRIIAWRQSEELARRAKPIRPSRHPHLCLFAAYMHDIAGLSEPWSIGHLTGMKGTEDLVYGRTVGPLPRYRTTERIVDQGRETAAAVGAWPWAEYENGKLPDRWWADAAALDAVTSASAMPDDLEQGRCPHPPGARTFTVPLFPL